jgi:gas vesicle protein GvpN
MIAEEIYLDSPEVEFLVPAIENFVETKQVRQLKNRVVRWVKIGYPPHIVGPTGCGKTTLALAVAKELGRPTLWINGDDQMTTSDLIGGYSEIETSSLRDRFIHNVMVAKDRTKYTWVDNPLTIACKYGYTLVYNEFSRAKPIANNVLLSVLEEGILELPIMFGKERYVKVHPDFNVIFTSNSIEYAGVHTPQDALLDRLVDIYMDFYNFDTEVKITRKHTGIPAAEVKKIVKAVRMIRDKMPEVSKPGTRAAIMIGHGMRATGDHTMEDIQQLYLDVMASKIGGKIELSKKSAIIEEVLRGIYGDP